MPNYTITHSKDECDSNSKNVEKPEFKHFLAKKNAGKQRRGQGSGSSSDDNDKLKHAIAAQKALIEVSEATARKTHSARPH